MMNETTDRNRWIAIVRRRAHRTRKPFVTHRRILSGHLGPALAAEFQCKNSLQKSISTLRAIVGSPAAVWGYRCDSAIILVPISLYK
jgi:hypothetical protein